MKRIILCGHTGSDNRGCEAIVRSTIGILNEVGLGDNSLYSYAVEQDKKRNLDKIVTIKPYKYPHKIFRGIYRYILKNPVKSHIIAYEKIVNRESPDWMFCIGGDTYCFARPYSTYAINRVSQRHNIPTVLWGCSIDESIFKNDVLKRDIQKYKHIVTREPLTYEILKQCVKPEQTLWQACDPAFRLESKECELPAVFKTGDVVGINLSPYFIKNNTKEDEQVFQNVKNLIQYLLEKTDLNICFIPHVFSFEKENQDFAVIKRFYEQYEKEERVGFLNQDLSCTEIKYVISRCRFFIGARTHTMIAAYSTGVPALALSYSIKSLGIAKDIFGTNEGYVLAKAELQKRDCLTDTFLNEIVKREEEIRLIYQKVMPEYKQSILDVARKIFMNISAEKE